MASKRAMTIRRAAVIIGLVSSTFAIPTAAFAQQPAPQPAAEEPSAADKETARSLMDQGVEREEAKDYAAALKSFQGAHSLVNLPMTGLAVARAQTGLGLLLEALEMATQVKHMPVRPNETPAFAKARADADALLQRLSSRIPSIQVVVEGTTEKIEISIDGNVLPPAAATLPRKVNPGKHVVVATAPGFEPSSQEVMVPEGKVFPVAITLQPITTARSPNNGNGGAGNGDGAGGGDKPPSSGGLSPLVFVGFGVGAAGLIAGTITGAISLSQTSSIKDRCNATGACPGDAAEDIKGANTLANVSNISFALGAAGVAVGVVGIFLSRSSGDPKPAAATTSLRITPVVGPLSVGVVGVF
jgi:hypothetical protein